MRSLRMSSALMDLRPNAKSPTRLSSPISGRQSVAWASMPRMGKLPAGAMSSKSSSSSTESAKPLSLW
eukprot:11126066-Lingulodinium_polyedra.AAC.1